VLFLVSETLGKFIEKIVGKSKKEEEQPAKKSSAETTAIPVSEKISNQSVSPCKTVYIKSMILNSVEELDKIKVELDFGNIIILRLTPLLDLDLDDAKSAVRILKKFTSKINGDIASLGEDCVIVTPSRIKIWRETKI